MSCPRCRTTATISSVAGLAALGLVGLIRHRDALGADEVARATVAYEAALVRAQALTESTPDAEGARLPREVEFITVKRSNPRFLRTYGHWWVEVDGVESYGWWADRCPIRIRDLLVGTNGLLNGVGGSCPGGTATTDPHHGEDADYHFHPTLVAALSDDDVRNAIRTFAHAYRGRWRYSLTSTRSGCHGFQLGLLDAAGLIEDPRHLHTRGPGCPFLFPLRRALWWLAETRPQLNRAATRPDR
jgi:hypothetical protein